MKNHKRRLQPMKFKKLLLFLPLIAITSCGYSLSYLVEGNKYNSPVFTENYYREDNAHLLKIEDKIVKEDIPFITSFNKISEIDQKVTAKSPEEYGSQYKMNSVDEIFNYGVQSKLFDGIVVCDGVLFQLLRVQADSNGFSISFSKESSEITYLAMQFKSTTNNQRACLVKPDVGPENVRIHEDREMYHESRITLKTSLYCKNDQNIIEKYSYKSTITNSATNNGSSYIFYGLDLREEHLTRVVGYSIAYEYDDDLINWNKEHGGPSDIEYALFMYELFMPYTTWH